MGRRGHGVGEMMGFPAAGGRDVALILCSRPVRQVEICSAILNVKTGPIAMSCGRFPQKNPQKCSLNAACSSLVVWRGGTMERVVWRDVGVARGCAWDGRGCGGDAGWMGGMLRDAEGCGEGSWGF